MKNSDFVHLHVHTEFSLDDSLLRAGEVVSLAKKAGMWAACITDVHNLFGVVKFYKEACKQGIKPVIGVQVRMVCTADVKEGGVVSKPRHFDVLLYCQNAQGYTRLCELLTRSYQSSRVDGKVVVDKAWLTPENCQGLLAVEPGVLGFSAGVEEGLVDALSDWQKLFPERYYLGLHRVGRQEDAAWEKRLVRLYQELNLPLVALNAVCFAKEDDFAAHEVRVCIQAGQVLEARKTTPYSKDQHWRGIEAMTQRFSDLPEAIKNTVEIAKRCTVFWKFFQTRLPDFPTPDAVPLQDFLRLETQKGLHERGEQLCHNHSYSERIETELGIINRMGFAGYFLIVADFIQWAKKHSIPVGPGRGSGAGSLVAFALGITDIDPLPHGLLFERFLNPERVSMPDFDIDFCMLNRDRVIAYVSERYGRSSVAQIITHGSMAAKASVRDVGRVLGHPYGFVDKLAKMIPMDLGITLEGALQQSQELSARYKQELEVTKLLDTALVLEGCVRNVGRHAGGVVISPGPLTNFCALYAEEINGQQVTHLDMGDVESVGLVKFDFLGLRTLTIIDQAVRWINEAHPEAPVLDMSAVALDDAKTFRLLQSGKTTAVFQLESRGFQELIVRLSPDVFADIVALVALYRPGPLQSGMVDDFIERKHGRAKVEYAHPCMESLLKETYGVIVYQEQVMQIAQSMAGYTLGAADLLRRAMGKKKPEEMAKQRVIFVEGSTAKGVETSTSEYVFDIMEKFAGYGFNKSHSVAYAFISYQTAYLKEHYPDYFMASVLSSDMDNTDKVVHYVEDCLRMGLKVLPPCVNKSRALFHVEVPGSIRYALSAIKGVGESMADAVATERERNGDFSDLLGFSMRLSDKINRKILEALMLSGAFDVWGIKRSVLLGSIDKVLAQKDQCVRSQNMGQGDLFGGGDGGHSLQTFQYAHALPGWGLKEQLAQEKLVLGRYFSGHPLDPYEQELTQIPSTPLAVLAKGQARTVQAIGVIERVKRMSTKQGRMFMLVEITDKTGVLEFACFDDKSLQIQSAMEEHDVVCVEGGFAARQQGEKRFQVKRIRSLQQMRLESAPTVRIILRAAVLKESQLTSLQAYLSKQPQGLSRVQIWYQTTHWRVPMEWERPCCITVSDTFLQGLRECIEEHTYTLKYV